jgi:hypothetical protein
LAKLVWAEAFGDSPSPWETPDTDRSPREVPQFLPIIFELAYRKLGEAAFLETLRKNLYSKVRHPDDDKKFKRSNESLAVIARLILQEYKRGPRRRIDAIITFNADDLLDRAVIALAAGPKRRGLDIIRSLARATHSDPAGSPRRPLPVYHIHGFVPSGYRAKYGYDHMLVFTDTQYWSTSASGAAFANRVIASALSEGRCVFVGLSMTDVNLLRWLALRTIEKDHDIAAIRNSQLPASRERPINWGFQRHFWIRPRSDDPTGFISEFLSLRGVDSVEIAGWKGRGLRTLIEACFPPAG